MFSKNISIDTSEKAKELCQIVKNIDSKATLTSGRYVINAKSILGIFSLNLSKPILLTIEDADKISKETKQRLEAYVCN